MRFLDNVRTRCPHGAAKSLLPRAIMHAGSLRRLLLADLAASARALPPDNRDEETPGRCLSREKPLSDPHTDEHAGWIKEAHFGMVKSYVAGPFVRIGQVTAPNVGQWPPRASSPRLTAAAANLRNQARLHRTSPSLTTRFRPMQTISTPRGPERTSELNHTKQRIEHSQTAQRHHHPMRRMALRTGEPRPSTHFSTVKTIPPSNTSRPVCVVRTPPQTGEGENTKNPHTQTPHRIKKG